MIRYTIAMPDPHTHRFRVTLEATASGPLDLALPVWTPGSYLVRDYARHVQGFAAEAAGEPLAWQKVDKTTWRVQAPAGAEVRASYEVYAYELTVRTSHLDDTHGYFNPATLCMFAPGRESEPHLVRVAAPEGWRVSTGLRAGPEPGTFLANDYDELVDSPFECGTHRLLTFEVEGVPHEIALWGSGNEDEGALVEDTRRLVVAARELFGGRLPYERYLFIVHLADGLYGGLEHRNSVTNLIDRWTFKPPRAYERYLELTAHEFYHVWNVKRIRPAPLGPFDYRRENYTRQLWVAEGITSYYDKLIVRRAGLMAPERYLELLAEEIATFESQPGKAVQSLAQSSFDTWIKFYRPDENTTNSSVSYYLKGSLVALLLDMEIRAQTEGERSLEDVLRMLYAGVYGGEDRPRFYDAPGFAEDGGFLAALEATVGTAGGAYRDLLARYVEGTAPLDYERGLAAVGLRPAWSHRGRPEGGPPASLGLRTKVEQGRLKVASVASGGAAERAGIYAGDELVALGGFRADEEKIRARLAERRPGDVVAVDLFRGDRLVRASVTLAEAAPDQLTLEQDPGADEGQRERYRAWLGLE